MAQILIPLPRRLGSRLPPIVQASGARCCAVYPQLKLSGKCMAIFLYLVVCAVFAAVGSIGASRKFRSSVVWGVVGFMLPIALLILLVLPPGRAPDAPEKTW